MCHWMTVSSYCNKICKGWGLPGGKLKLCQTGAISNWKQHRHTGNLIAYHPTDPPRSWCFDHGQIKQTTTLAGSSVKHHTHAPASSSPAVGFGWLNSLRSPFLLFAIARRTRPGADWQHCVAMEATTGLAMLPWHRFTKGWGWGRQMMAHVLHAWRKQANT